MSCWPLETKAATTHPARLFLTLACEAHNEEFSHFSVGVRLYTQCAYFLNGRAVERAGKDAWRVREAFAFGGCGLWAKSIIINITKMILDNIVPSTVLSRPSVVSPMVLSVHFGVDTIIPTLWRKHSSKHKQCSTRGCRVARPGLSSHALKRQT